MYLVVIRLIKGGFLLVIKNKLESIRKIKELDLNRFPEEMFKKGEEDKIQQFIKRYPAKYYAIRDKEKASGVFKLKVDRDKVIEEIKDYNLFTINVSSANYVENQLLVGEIQILRNSEVYATLSVDGEASVRDALKNPSFNIKTTIFDDKTLNKIPHFNFIYSYIVEHDLQDFIVEFSLFDKEVGRKKEQVVVYELRTHY